MDILIFGSVIIAIFVIYEFNVFITLKNKLKQAKSTIDVYLAQRFDLIPNLLACVKSYADYEKQTLTVITELREAYSNTKSLEVGQALTNKMNDLIVRAENMADIKADTQFLILQRNLIRIESQLQAARRIYNGDVTLYNTTIQTFPNNIIASLFKMQPKDLFVIEEYQAQNIEVEV